MTKPLLAILLLLLVACDPGETLTELLDERPDGLDGKGLVCERLNLPWRTRPRWVNYPYDGFRFVDGEVEWDMIAQGTVDAPENAVSARVSTVANAGYKGYPQSRTEIFWWGDWFVLDRKTLELENTREHNKKYQCKAFSTPDSYNDEIDRHLRKLQQEFAREMKDNKI